MNIIERCNCTCRPLAGRTGQLLGAGLTLVAAFSLAGSVQAQLSGSSDDLTKTQPEPKTDTNLNLNAIAELNEGPIDIVNEWWNDGMALDGDTVVEWDNGGPDGVNGLSHFQGVLTGVTYDRTVIDDFVLDGPVELTWAQVSGVWFAGTDCGTAFGDFRVRVWADDSNNNPVVGPPIADVTATRKCTTTGNVFFGRPEVVYIAKFEDNPIALEPGKYWVSIQPTGTTDNFFHLTAASGGNIFKQQIHLWYVQDGQDVNPQWTPGFPAVFGDTHDVVFMLGSGKPPQPEPPKCNDITGDGTVGPADLLVLLDCWGPVTPDCEAADLNGDGVVDWFDLLKLLGDWGCFTDELSCGHPEAGDCCSANGTPYCDDAACCEAVCMDDPFCCNTNWDSLCAGTANDICDICDVIGCGHPDAGDCCVAQTGSPFCDDEECCLAVCAGDPFCCDTNWDSICAGTANDICDVCDGGGHPACGPGAGDCCLEGGNGTPGCEDEDCCNANCAQDPFCCDSFWDDLCASWAQDNCAVCQ